MHRAISFDHSVPHAARVLQPLAARGNITLLSDRGGGSGGHAAAAKDPRRGPANQSFVAPVVQYLGLICMTQR
jgi:hypothetical protein